MMHRGVSAPFVVSRGEAKDSALLSSRDGYLLEPTKWPKGSQASCGVWKDASSGKTRRFHIQLNKWLVTPEELETPGKNTGVGCHLLLQEIFSTHRLHLHLLLGRQILRDFTGAGLIRIAKSLQSWDRRVRPRLV